MSILQYFPVLAPPEIRSKKCFADGALRFLTAPAFHWADGDSVAHVAVSCSVLERISEVASTPVSLVSTDADSGVPLVKPKRTRRVGEPKPKRYPVGEKDPEQGT